MIVYEDITVSDRFRLAFRQYHPVQDKVDDECLGVNRDRDNLIGPGAGLTKIN